MRALKSKSFYLCLRWAIAPFSLLVTLLAYAGPPAEPEFQRFFKHYVDKRSLPEKALNVIGLTSQDVGRSFALVAGISDYDHLGNLRAADVDIRNLVSYLNEQEFFDEIVVLRDKDFTEENLRYFLQAYFPERVSRFPRSRFLFTFSGHGMNDGDQGYLLFKNAKDMKDKYRTLNLRTVRTYLQEVVRKGHHVLALVNSCYGGNLVSSSFGGERLLPRKRGAHVITAGGPNELVYADPDVGPGSVFFETFFAALEGRADTYPPADRERGRNQRGDGLITFDELVVDLKSTIRQWSSERVNPLSGDLNPITKRSLGSFFFLNRDRQIEEGIVAAWKPGEEFGRSAERYSKKGTGTSLSEKIAFSLATGEGPWMNYTEIYVMDADGANPTRVTNNRAWDAKPTWSPDGAKIAFESDRDGNHEIYVMNADGTNPRRVTDNPTWDSGPSWSPDGAKIAFESDRDGNYEIYVMNVDGTNPRRVTNDPARDIHSSWSPDGAKIVFDSDRDGNEEIYVMNADGTNRRRVTNNSAWRSFTPSWSPHGAKIAFASDRDGNYEIYVMNVDGTNPRRVTNDRARFNSSPSWSPDGTKIIFDSEGGQGEFETGIYVMNADGTNRRRINDSGFGSSWSVVLR